MFEIVALVIASVIVFFTVEALKYNGLYKSIGLGILVAAIGVVLFSLCAILYLGSIEYFKLLVN